MASGLSCWPALLRTTRQGGVVLSDALHLLHRVVGGYRRTCCRWHYTSARRLAMSSATCPVPLASLGGVEYWSAVVACCQVRRRLEEWRSWADGVPERRRVRRLEFCLRHFLAWSGDGVRLLSRSDRALATRPCRAAHPLPSIAVAALVTGVHQRLACPTPYGSRAWLAPDLAA